MGTDQLINLLSEVSVKLLPIALLILLIFAIVFIKRLCDLAKETSKQVEKLDRPLETVGNLSDTVDKVNDAINSSVKTGVEVVNTKLTDIKNKMDERKEAKKAKHAVKEDECCPTKMVTIEVDENCEGEHETK